MSSGNEDKAGVSRRSFLQGSAGAAALAATGTLALPRLANAAGGLVALVHTQAAGDNGPIDSMIAALKKLSGEKEFPMRAIYAQEPATYETIFKTLGDAGAAVMVSTFNEVGEPMKALAPNIRIPSGSRYSAIRSIRRCPTWSPSPTTIISAAICPACSVRRCRRQARLAISAASRCRRSMPMSIPSRRLPPPSSRARR